MGSCILCLDSTRPWKWRPLLTGTRNRNPPQWNQPPRTWYAFCWWISPIRVHLWYRDIIFPLMGFIFHKFVSIEKMFIYFSSGFWSWIGRWKCWRERKSANQGRGRSCPEPGVYWDLFHCLIYLFILQLSGCLQDLPNLRTPYFWKWP